MANGPGDYVLGSLIYAVVAFVSFKRFKKTDLIEYKIGSSPFDGTYGNVGLFLPNIK
jgi:hypothetical protein